MHAIFVQSRLSDDPDSVTLVWAEGACEYDCSLVRVFINPVAPTRRPVRWTWSGEQLIDLCLNTFCRDV